VVLLKMAQMAPEKAKKSVILLRIAQMSLGKAEKWVILLKWQNVARKI
jgi:hypothetical protein